MADTPLNNTTVRLNDADGYLWDVSVGSSYIVNGTSDAFDGGFRWLDYRSSGGTHVLTDGREVNLGPTQLIGQPAGLFGSRSIYISDTLGYARFLDTITNTTAAAITYSYDLYTNLGSDSYTRVVATSDGDTTFETTDTYLSTDDSSLTGRDPTVTHVLHDDILEPSSINLSRDIVRVTYDITIEAGQSVSMLSFGFQNRTPADAASEVSNFEINFGNYLEGLSVLEMSQVVNFALSTGAPSPGDDVLIGTNGDDTIYARAGNDKVLAGDGNDLIDGSGGNDTVYAGDGDDTVLAGTGMDLVIDGEGSDTYQLAGGNDTLKLTDAEFGNDVADGGFGFDLLDLSNFTERLHVDLTAGTVRQNFSPSDIVTGFEAVLHSDGSGQITGTFQANSLIARGGDDTVFAGSGNDTVTGDGGNDRLFGEDGTDLLSGGIGDDTASGGSGNDTLNGESGNDRLVGGSGDDTLDGGTGDDRLIGQSGDDLLLGGSGADHLIGGAGNDRYEGGLGNDILVDDGPSSESDTFVFTLGGGDDLVSGYDQGFNILELDSNLWGGGLGVQQVVNRYAFESGAGTRILLDFGEDSILLVNENGLDITTLASDLVLV